MSYKRISAITSNITIGLFSKDPTSAIFVYETFIMKEPPHPLQRPEIALLSTRFPVHQQLTRAASWLAMFQRPHPLVTKPSRKSESCLHRNVLVSIPIHRLCSFVFSLFFLHIQLLASAFPEPPPPTSSTYECRKISPRRSRG